MGAASGISDIDVEQTNSAQEQPSPSAQELLRRSLKDKPWPVKFFQMVRLIERLHPERKPVGIFVAPADEVLRFSTHTTLGFPASEIQSYTENTEGPDRLTVNFMGLTAMNGPLPPPYAELLLERVRSKDPAPGEFFDLFNHRVISLFYRAWKKHRFFVAYEQTGGETDLITRSLYDLIGLGTPGLQGRMEIEDDATIFYAGLLSQSHRTAQGLKQILEDYFAVPVAIEQFTGSWNRLPSGDQTCLNESKRQSECLGIATVVGNEVWYEQGTVTVRLGPMPLERYRDLLPGAPAHRQLAAWLRLYGRQELDFVVRLVLAREEVPQLLLSAEEPFMARLGFASWLKNRPFERDPDEAMYRVQ